MMDTTQEGDVEATPDSTVTATPDDTGQPSTAHLVTIVTPHRPGWKTTEFWLTLIAIAIGGGVKPLADEFRLELISLVAHGFGGGVRFLSVGPRWNVQPTGQHQTVQSLHIGGYLLWIIERRKQDGQAPALGDRTDV